jgi:hypothetical protein
VGSRASTSGKEPPVEKKDNSMAANRNDCGTTAEGTTHSNESPSVSIQ